MYIVLNNGDPCWTIEKENGQRTPELFKTRTEAQAAVREELRTQRLCR